MTGANTRITCQANPAAPFWRDRFNLPRPPAIHLNDPRVFDGCCFGDAVMHAPLSPCQRVEDADSLGDVNIDLHSLCFPRPRVSLGLKLAYVRMP
jgi:hypothetical protein